MANRFPAAILLVLSSGCALTATRPIQQMSDTVSAIRAAKEVQADTLAPELYRQASEWFFRAKREYKFKNFKEAREYARKSRLFAEEAEFIAIHGGGNRVAADVNPLSETPPPPPEPDQPVKKADPGEYSQEGSNVYYEAYEAQQKTKEEGAGGGEEGGGGE